MQLTQKDKAIIKAGIIWDSLVCIGLFLILLGIASNHVCILSNNGMPVKANLPANTFYPGNGIHFYYGSYNSINYFYLSDIFPINQNVYSIGDFIIYFGALWICISSIFGGYWFFKKVKKIKRHFDFGY